MEAIVKTEVFIYVLEHLGYKDMDISKAWTLLSGYHKNVKSTINIKREHIKFINKAKGFLIDLSGSTTYRKYLDIYKNFSEVNNLLYFIEDKDEKVTFKVNLSSKLKSRKDMIEKLLRSKIEIEKSNIVLYKEKYGIFKNNGGEEGVNFTRSEKELNEFEKQNVIRDIKREKIIVNKSELLETAKFIDSKIKYRNYTERVSNITFDVLSNEGIEKKDHITIDGLFNLIGRVGSGKSTLVEVLSCKLALEGKKIAIVVNG
nr:hypothetical protein [Clostridium isatidis]